MERCCAIIFLFCASLLGQSGPYVHPPQGNVYYISTSGNDSNNGTSASPWASPSHSVNCGDVIIAQTGTYTASNFASGKWGTVTCSSGVSVAWVICATFDACKISAGTASGMLVSSSYWGIANWEVTNSSTGGPCFGVTPPTTGAGIHHVVFVNNIANGCGAAGFSAYSNAPASVDYIAFVGNIVYNASQNSTNCYSGLDMFQPVASDSNTGTHMYMAGNFSYGNLDPNPCAGGLPTNGDGAIFDTWDWKGVGGSTIYSQQSVMKNNILICNGGRGWETQNYVKNPATNSNTIIANNTTWDNATDPNQSTNLCDEGQINLGYGITVTGNIMQAINPTSCPLGGGSPHTMYGMFVYDSTTASSPVSGNFVNAASGSNTGSFNDDSNTFSFGSNTVGTSPSFAAPACPSAPSCGSSTSTANCMATVISNFTPSASGTSGKGYQPAILNSNGSDATYPHWLCVAGLPSGLITPSC